MRNTRTTQQNDCDTTQVQMNYAGTSLAASGPGLAVVAVLAVIGLIVVSVSLVLLAGKALDYSQELNQPTEEVSTAADNQFDE